MSLKEKSSPSASIFPVSSSSSLATIPTSKADVDVEKSAVDCDEEGVLSNYAVPVLEKGVKTALKGPTSPWVRFRVWYNPYRLVRRVVHRSYIRATDRQIRHPALHADSRAQYGRHIGGLSAQIPLRRETRRCHCTRQYCRCSGMSKRAVPSRCLLGRCQAVPKGKTHPSLIPVITH